jgi:hypothetical protein
MHGQPHIRFTDHLFVRQREKGAIYSSAEYSGVRMSLITFAGKN